MKKLAWLIALLTLGLGVGASVAQSTTVSTTGVVDTDSLTWSNGTYQISFVPNSTYPSINTYVWSGGSLINNSVFTGSLSGTGTFSASIPSNTAIQPSGSQWKFTICPNATSGCINAVFPATGSTYDITSLLNAYVVGPRFASNPTAFGYGTIEVSPNPLPGALFYNTTTSTCTQWSGIAWASCGGGGVGTVTNVSGATANGLTVAVASPTTTPVIGAGPDSSHLIPVNTGSSSLYLNQAGGYTTPPGTPTAPFAGTGIPFATSTTTSTVATSPQIVAAANNTPSTTFVPALLPLATTSAFGVVKPDGTTISIAGGVISAVTSGSITGTATMPNTAVGIATCNEYPITWTPSPPPANSVVAATPQTDIGGTGTGGSWTVSVLYDNVSAAYIVTVCNPTQAAQTPNTTIFSVKVL